jgi:predicted esterase
VDAVGDALEREFGAPRAIVFAGFSQGVAMAWRAAMKGRRNAAAIVTAGGDVAPDILDATRTWPRVLMLTGKTDPWYTPERLESEAAQLRSRGADVRTQVFEGGHEWGDAVPEAVGELLGEAEGSLA